MLKIQDLAVNKELDKKAMANVSGGWTGGLIIDPIVNTAVPSSYSYVTYQMSNLLIY